MTLIVRQALDKMAVACSAKPISRLRWSMVRTPAKPLALVFGFVSVVKDRVSLVSAPQLRSNSEECVCE